MTEKYDVVVIGAGHVGLTASALLKSSSIDHIVLEKDEIANTWKTQRWDSFNLVLPNWTLKLPNYHYSGPEPDGYLNLKETIKYVEDFASIKKLPVRTKSEVSQLRFLNSKYVIATNSGIIEAKNVVIATGSFNRPRIPDFSKSLSPHIRQIHSSQYKNPNQFKSNATVLVVGTGQSGAQIAEELHKNGRTVYLSLSRCGGRPRRYRGKDCVWWMQERGYYDQSFDKTSRSQRPFACNVPLTGSEGGYDLNFNDFHLRGIHLFGRITTGDQNLLTIDSDLHETLDHAHKEWTLFLEQCDQYAKEKKLDLPLEPQAYSFLSRKSRPAIRTELNLEKEQINDIIWATGFEFSFPWIELPNFNANDYLTQQNSELKNGLMKFPGLFFLGFPWMRKRKSSIFLGTTEDAELVVSKIISLLQP